MMKALGHEKLLVYQKSIEFCAWSGELLEDVPKGASARDQLDRASTSICLNIAEGAGRYTSKDQARFYDISRGSALECGACLDVLVARRLAPPDRVAEGKELLISVVSLLVKLIQSGDHNRLYEDSTPYETNPGA
jgi:four helix bundle protein